MKVKNIAIIGAGITGLVTAFYLKKKGIPYTIFDKQNRTGGVIHTIKKDGFIYETGPNSGIISNSEVVELFDDLKDIITPYIANKVAGQRLIRKRENWHALPSGPVSAIKTPLFTLQDKFRILGEPFRKKGKDPDETLAKMVKRRLGKSFLDYAVDPFVLGIYAGDPAYLVPRYALPKLYNLEQNYGSFIRGAVRIKKERKKDLMMQKVTKEIFSFQDGLQSLTDTLSDIAGYDNIVLGATTLTVEKAKQGYLVCQNDEKIPFSGVVSTVPAGEIGNLFPFIGKKETDWFNSLQYARVIEIAVGFKKWEGMPLHAFGGLIPFIENSNILGILFMSSLFSGRAPEQGALFSVFMGGTRKAYLTQLNHREIKEVVATELLKMLQLEKFEPDLFEVMKHDQAIAQYGVNTGSVWQAITRVEKKFPGLVLAGSIRDGIGMADRIKQAKIIAGQIS